MARNRVQRSLRQLGLVIAAVLWQASGVMAEDRIRAVIWPSEAGVPNVPERQDCAFLATGERNGRGQPCPADGHLSARPSFGIAFSGGGTRSAAATIGQLRALSALGLLDKTRYVTAVSGGSWAAVPWTFAPERLSEADLLGRYTPPEDIDGTRLADPSAAGRIAGSIAEARLAEPFLDAALSRVRDEKFAKALEAAFLRPVELGGSDKLFTFDRQSAEDIGTRNRWLGGSTLRTTREGRPFLVALGALTTTRGHRKAAWVPFEMTPLYVGAPGLDGWDNRDAWGGGYVEPFAYDTDLIERRAEGGERQVAAEWVRDRGGNPFSLSDVIGTSGAAPADIVDRFDLLGLLGFPRFRHWPVKGDARDNASFNHGDGGFVDNLGVTSLLARRVETIFAFINTVVQLCAEGRARKGECTAPNLEDEPKKVNDDLRQLFIGRDNAPGRIVFEGGAEALQDIVSGLTADVRDGHPAVECRDHRVIPNEYFSIVEPYTAHVCWFYLEWAQAWADRLRQDDDLVRSLADREGDFVRFPHYETFFENAISRRFRDILRSMGSHFERITALRAATRNRNGNKRVVQLRSWQIQALADFTAWSLCDAAEGGQIVLPAAAIAGSRLTCVAGGG